MRKLKDIDILGDAELQARVLRSSIAIAAVGIAVAVVVVCAGLADMSKLSLLWILAFVVGCVVPLAVHEFIHAIAFKILAPGCHVSFGWQDSFIYTKTDGAILARRDMTCVLLAPTVILSVVLLVVPAVLGHPVLGWLLMVMHLSGCTGDILMAIEAWECSECTHVQDTEFGVTLLAE